MPVDKDKMKALALAAGGAAWSEPSQEYNDRGYRYWQIVDSADVEVIGDYGLSEEVASFVATANPAAVLELLAENDKLNQERDELRAEVERLKMNAERYQLMRAELSSGDLEYYRLEGGPQDDIDAYCDAQLAECAAIAAHSKAGKP